MKRINGFEDYLITSFGDIYSLKSNKWLKSMNNGTGYLYVALYKNSKSYNKYVHRLVAITFILNPDNKPSINHIDGNKQNNCVNNLEWVTKSENEIHAYKIGLKNSKHCQGFKNYNSKLTENDVLTIHGLYLSGMKQKEISKIYKISKPNISDIINGKTWKHLIFKEE